MKLLIKSGTLEAELEGNPLEQIQTQLQQAIQKQDEDIQAVGAHVNDNLVGVHRMVKQVSDASQQKIAEIQAELDQAVSQLLLQILKSNEVNPEIKALGDKVKKLSAMRSQKPKTKVITKTVTKTVTKQAKPKDEGIEKLHSTINNIRRVPVSKYPKSEWKVRKSIAQADKPVYSSESKQIDKLNAVPRMPI